MKKRDRCEHHRYRGQYGARVQAFCIGPTHVDITWAKGYNPRVSVSEGHYWKHVDLSRRHGWTPAAVAHVAQSLIHQIALEQEVSRIRHQMELLAK